MKIVIAFSLVGLLSACSTMEFVNGPKMDETVVREQWHHLGINGLIEYSAPLNLDYNCGNQQWDSATVEVSFFNWLANLTYPAVSIYSPWTIVYECREPID